jgi:thioredoxin 1
MSKFGEIINTDVPVLINFYTDRNESLGDKAKVIKIDVEKNKDLAEALRIKGIPTLMVYKNAQMVWRQSGEQDANSIILTVQQYF